MAATAAAVGLPLTMLVAQEIRQERGFDVTLHKDDLRVLTFDGATVTSANAGEKVEAEKQGDEWSVSVNDFYYYTIPEAVIAGG